MPGAVAGISIDAMQALCQFEGAASTDEEAICRNRPCLIIDCRSFIAFNCSHIIGAVNINCPPILKRRSGGTLKLQHVLSSDQVRADLLDGQYSSAVFYDDHTLELNELNQDSLVLMAIKVVQETNRLSHIYFLQGGYELFFRRFDHLCRLGQLPNTSQHHQQQQQQQQQPAMPTICITGAPPSATPDLVQSTKELKLIDDACLTSGLTVSLPPSVDRTDNQSSRKQLLGSPSKSIPFHILRDQGDPIFILPWLCIGNSYHALQEERLKQLGLNAKLNVAGQHPAVSYTESRDFRCLSIPVTDTSTENIISWFPTANEFIELIRQADGKVLVHCQAGISRSATICIAYLMYLKDMTLDEAYDFVQAKRSIIAPNMNFMRQLFEYEKQLLVVRKQPTTEDHLSTENKQPNVLSSLSFTHRSVSLSFFPNRRQCFCDAVRAPNCNSSSLFSPSGRHSSPSVLVSSPYLDQRHLCIKCSSNSRRIRRSSFDLGRQHRNIGSTLGAHRVRFHGAGQEDDHEDSVFLGARLISGVLRSPLLQSA